MKKNFRFELFFFGSMSVFFLIQADKEGEVGKAGFKSGLGNVIFAALNLAFSMVQANVVSVINGRQTQVFAEKSAEICLAHIAKLCVIGYFWVFAPMLLDLYEGRVELFVFLRDARIAFVDPP